MTSLSHTHTHTHTHTCSSSPTGACVMFNVVSRKYVPTRPALPDDPPRSVQPVHVSESADAPEATWPPHGAKMRISKANKGPAVVRALRPHTSPPPASLESLEAAWSERGRPEAAPERREPEAEGHGAGPQRSRKRGFRPPDVRTIFSPEERDPRVKEESGEGHTFQAGGEDTWCDACCLYMFQPGLTCAGTAHLELPWLCSLTSQNTAQSVV